MLNLDQLTFSKIMKLTFKELRLSTGSIIHKSEINKIKRELSSKKIDIKTTYFIADEWYSPDGYSAIAIPFYLCHPKLIRLEKKMMGIVEGETAHSFTKLLRHEMAHVLDNHYGLRKNKTRQKLFGLSSVPYPDHYDFDPESRAYVTHLDPHYAQAHPEEDWAETFAVWLNPNSNWRVNYKNWSALKKLELVDSVMTDLRPRAYKKVNIQEMGDISKSDQTIGEYYQQKLQRHADFGHFYLRNKMSEHLQKSKKQKALYSRIKQQKKHFIKALESKHTFAQVNRFHNDFLVATKGEKQNFHKSDKDLLQLMVETTHQYVNNGHHRIVM